MLGVAVETPEQTPLKENFEINVYKNAEGASELMESVFIEVKHWTWI